MLQYFKVYNISQQTQTNMKCDNNMKLLPQLAGQRMLYKENHVIAKFKDFDLTDTK